MVPFHSNRKVTKTPHKPDNQVQSPEAIKGGRKELTPQVTSVHARPHNRTRKMTFFNM